MAIGVTILIVASSFSHGISDILFNRILRWAAGQVSSTEMPEDLEILDREGGGDSFASGLIYGLLTGLPVEQALRYGVAHGALAMTTPGDTSMATLAEVSRLVAGGSARVVR